jgi:hypothetical protein
MKKTDIGWQIRLIGACGLFVSACTLHHSKQALSATDSASPSSNATFVTEEDSGLMLFGVLQLSEPDHYAVLLERARRRFRCARVHHAQLDFFTDHWILVSFPIARLTLVCEPPSPRSVHITKPSEPANDATPSSARPSSATPVAPTSADTHEADDARGSDAAHKTNGPDRSNGAEASDGGTPADDAAKP